MAGVKVKVFIQDIDQVKNLIQSVSDLMNHIDHTDFQNSNGDALKMNSAYVGVKSALSELPKK